MTAPFEPPEFPQPADARSAVSSGTSIDTRVQEQVREEIDRLLPESKGQLGLVAQCLRDNISDRRAIVEAGAAANTGAVGNILAGINAMRDGTIPESAPTVARLAASSTRSFMRQHRGELSPAAEQHLAIVVERLTEAAEDRRAQEREEAQLQERGDDLEEALATQGGVYVFTFPQYWRYPTVEGTRRTLLKVGMTTRDAHIRVRQQARQTSLPEDPILLRVYQHPTREPRDCERDFHELLDAADHGRTDTRAGGREWFETSVEFLDAVARILGMSAQTVEADL